MPYDNEYNKSIAQDVMKLNKRYLDHEKRTGQLSGGFLGALAGMLMPTLVGKVADKLFGSGEMEDVADYQYASADKDSDYYGGALGSIGGFARGTFMDTGFDRTIGGGMSAGVKRYNKMKGGTLLGNGECGCGMSGGKLTEEEKKIRGELKEKIKTNKKQIREEKDTLKTIKDNCTTERRAIRKNIRKNRDEYQKENDRLKGLNFKNMDTCNKEIGDQKQEVSTLKGDLVAVRTKLKEEMKKPKPEKPKKEKSTKPKKPKKTPVVVKMETPDIDFTKLKIPKGYTVVKRFSGEVIGTYLRKGDSIYTATDKGKVDKKIGTIDDTTNKITLMEGGRMYGGNVVFPRVPVANMKASSMAGQGKSDLVRFNEQVKELRQVKPELTYKEARNAIKEVFASLRPAKSDTPKRKYVRTKPLKEKKKPMTRGGKSRAEIVKEVMKDRGVSMIEASKIVKAEGLY
jgi:hypothetical protein